MEDLGRPVDSRGLTLTELSLRWLLSEDHVNVVFLGASRCEQLAENRLAGGLRTREVDRTCRRAAMASALCLEAKTQSPRW